MAKIELTDRLHRCAPRYRRTSPNFGTDKASTSIGLVQIDMVKVTSFSRSPHCGLADILDAFSLCYLAEPVICGQSRIIDHPSALSPGKPNLPSLSRRRAGRRRSSRGASPAAGADGQTRTQLDFAVTSPGFVLVSSPSTPLQDKGFGLDSIRSPFDDCPDLTRLSWVNS